MWQSRRATKGTEGHRSTQEQTAKHVSQGFGGVQHSFVASTNWVCRGDGHTQRTAPAVGTIHTATLSCLLSCVSCWTPICPFCRFPLCPFGRLHNQSIPVSFGNLARQLIPSSMSASFGHLRFCVIVSISYRVLGSLCGLELRLYMRGRLHVLFPCCSTIQVRLLLFCCCIVGV